MFLIFACRGFCIIPSKFTTVSVRTGDLGPVDLALNYRLIGENDIFEFNSGEKGIASAFTSVRWWFFRCEHLFLFLWLSCSTSGDSGRVPHDITFWLYRDSRFFEQLLRNQNNDDLESYWKFKSCQNYQYLFPVQWLIRTHRWGEGERWLNVN